MVGIVSATRPPIATRPVARPAMPEVATTDELLSKVLASVAYLRLTSHMAHFNVTGPSFYSDHKTYEGVYGFLDEWIDKLGERITALGHPVDIHPECLTGDCVVFPSGHTAVDQDAKGLCLDVLSKLQAISDFINSIFRQVDETTANMLQELCLGIDKQIYFVRRGWKAE